MKSLQHLGSIGKYDEWETPQSILFQVMEQYDIHPVLDVCASDYNAKFPLYFTKKDDSLRRCWTRDFFMNPPYSQVAKFVAKAYREHVEHDVDGLVLAFAKTDTRWWHNYVEGVADDVCFIRGRLRFYRRGYRSRNNAPYPSCFIMYRKRESKRKRQHLQHRLLIAQKERGQKEVCRYYNAS